MDNSKKCIYTVCTIPRNRQEQGEGGILYSQPVLRFTRDGSSVDYIGQQGPGGTPFPHIRNIYTINFLNYFLIFLQKLIINMILKYYIIVK